MSYKNKVIILHAPAYLCKFIRREFGNSEGVVKIPLMAITCSKHMHYYKRYAQMKKRYTTTLVIESYNGLQDVRYLSAIEFHLRNLFYTHLWTAVRVSQKFHYPAFRAIRDFLDAYRISPDELDPDSLYRQWQRVKSDRKRTREAQKSHRRRGGQQLNLLPD